MTTNERIELKGISLSPGLADGQIYIHKQLSGCLNLPVNIKAQNLEEELYVLDKATIKISHDLNLLAAKVEEDLDSRFSNIFAAHQMIINDFSLREELRKEITANLINASSAVKVVMLRWEKRFLSMESQIAKDKGDDIHELSLRMQNTLDGVTLHPLDDIPQGIILATTRLMASDIIFLAERSILAIILEYGSTASHAALFAREMNIPCVAGLPGLLNKAENSSHALVDSNAGSIIFSPNDDDITIFKEKVKLKEIELNRARGQALGPAITLSGAKISIFANVGSDTDTKQALHNGAEGIGLLRLETLYLARTSAPDCDELFEHIKNTVKVFKGRPIYIRLLDLGSDKQIPFMDFLAESNPALGMRGVRYLLNYPELLKTQLKAILKISLEFDVKIIIPMVTLASDIIEVKRIIHSIAEEMDMQILPKLGVMIETPASALMAVSLSEHVDFMSIGTNDLTQYVFAADRENASVEKYFDDASEAIFRLIEMIHEDLPYMPLTLCGELAGRPEQIDRILNCGIRVLSVAAPLIPIIKEAVRKST